MNRKAILPAALAMTMSAGAAFADGGAPTVVELFTSQGCYSCPPAERFLGDLAGQDSVLALEFHVDYWDDLVYGAAGKWKDPFSSPAYTARQSGYNVRIRGRRNVYTPQMVIDGRLEAVGSRRLEVLSQVREAEKTRGPRVGVAVTADGRRVTGIRLSGGGGGQAGVWLVRMLKERRTEVPSGENKGKSLLSRNIVTEMRRIGDWTGEDRVLPVPDFTLEDGEGCAVLVQEETQGPIRGAAPCPAPLG